MPVSAEMKEDPGCWMQRLSQALHPSSEALQTPSLAVRVAGGQDQYWAWRWRVTQLPLLSPLLESASSSEELVILLAPEFVEEECRELRELLTRNDQQAELGGLWGMRPVEHREQVGKFVQEMVMEKENMVQCEKVATEKGNLDNRKTLTLNKEDVEEGDSEKVFVDNGNVNQVDLEEEGVYQFDVEEQKVDAGNVKEAKELGNYNVKNLEEANRLNEKVVNNLDTIKHGTKSNSRKMAKKRLEDTDNWMPKPASSKRDRKVLKYAEDSSSNSEGEEHMYLEKRKRKKIMNVREPGRRKVEKSNLSLENIEHSSGSSNGTVQEETEDFMFSRRHVTKKTLTKGKLDSVMFRLKPSNYFHPSRSVMKHMKTSYVQKLARKDRIKETIVDSTDNNNSDGYCILCGKLVKYFKSNYAKHLAGVHFREQLNNFYFKASDGSFGCNFCSYKGKTSSYISEHVGGVHRKLEEVAPREVMASVPGRRPERLGVQMNTIRNFNKDSSMEDIDVLLDSD